MSDDGVEAAAAREVERFCERELDRPRAPLDVVEGLRTLGLLESGALADPALCASVLEPLARRSASAALVLFGHYLADRLMPGAPSGLGGSPCYADLAEDESGVVARLEGDRATLDGHTDLVVNAPLAEWLALPVALDGARVVARVHTGGAGVSRSPALATLGLRDCPTGDVQLADVRIGVDHLGRPDLESIVREARGPAVAVAAGVLSASFQTAEAHARERVQGGQPIIDHTQVRAMLADLGAAARTCHALGRRLSTVGVSEAESAALFLQAKDVWCAAASDGVQLLGGYGYMADYPQEARMRDARQLRALLGTPDRLRQRMIAP